MADIDIPHAKPREIRVFLSSTFKDMEHERQYLVAKVFPDIRDYCRRRNLAFTDIDLRWGITEEESRSGRTLEICLEEIDRCRQFPPFFIGFLGERYGWRPAPDDVAHYRDQDADSPYGKSIQDAVQAGMGATELEMQLAVLGTDAHAGVDAKAPDNVLFLLRAEELTRRYCLEGGSAAAASYFYDPAGTRLQRLKEQIRSSAYHCVDGYAELEAFGDAVHAFLTSRIDAEFPTDKALTPLELAEAAHAAFAASRLESALETACHVPRVGTLYRLAEALAARVREPGLGPLLLTGPSGQGKSTVLADFARYCRAALRQHVVLEHYVGADDIADLHGWLGRVLEVLQHRFPETFRNERIPQQPEARRDAMATWVARACRAREHSMGAEPGSVRVLLLIDALDQLRDGGNDVAALTPRILGADAIVLASCVEGSPAWRSTTNRQWQTMALPALDLQEVRALLETHRARYRRSLPQALLEHLVKHPTMGVPLFNRLVLEKLRRSANDTDLEAWAHQLLVYKDSGSMFVANFLQDYPDSGRPRSALDFMALIAASRDGLYETELRYLLAAATDPLDAHTQVPLLPALELSRLLAHFQPYLLRRQGRLLAMHKSLGEAALELAGDHVLRRRLVAFYTTEWRASRNPDRVALELPINLWLLDEDAPLLVLLCDASIAGRICSRNFHEFARYWAKVAKPAAGRSDEAALLARRLQDQQLAQDLPWPLRARQLASLAQAFLQAGERGQARDLYLVIDAQANKPDGQVPVESRKDCLRGLVQCFLKHSQEVGDIGQDTRMASLPAFLRERVPQCIAEGDAALHCLEQLRACSQEDSCVSRADDALLRNEVRGARACIKGLRGGARSAHDLDLQIEEVQEAIAILQGEACKASPLVHATMAKAYINLGRIDLEKISACWHKRAACTELISLSIEDAVKFQAYVQEHLAFGDLQRVGLLENRHVLWVNMALVADSEAARAANWQIAAQVAYETLMELYESPALGEMRAMRFLNAAETMMLARQNGCEIPPALVAGLLAETADYQAADDLGPATRNFAADILYGLQQPQESVQ